MSDNRITIDQLIDQVGNLPPMPKVVQKALHIIRDPNSSMKDLANVIKMDQAMTSLILRWVNSGYYSLRYKLISIEQAVSYLGQRTVQNLVLSASVASFMNRPVPGYLLDKGELWKRSVGMAAGAQLIVKDVDPELYDDAYYAGLFCDVGKLAFDVLLRYNPVDPRALEQHSFDEMEVGLFGFNHAAVGAGIVRRWNFPERLAEAVLYHHTPSLAQDKHKTLCYAVHAADAILMMFGVGIGRDSLQYKLDPMTPTILKWKDNNFENFYNRVIPIIEEAEAFLKLGY
ncbi:MAG: HDOD domain-containing protein [Anaerolineae bacterium]|nr:HDOD domain-containing protein [Anaerolineae bacterium]